MEDSPKLSLHLCPPSSLQSRPNSYIARLEHELTKIQSFKRELPLSCLLLADAVERLKREGKEVGMVENCDSEDDDKKSWMSSAKLWSFDGKEKDGEDCNYVESGGVFSSFMDEVGVSGPGLSVQVRSEPAGVGGGGRFTSGPVPPPVLQGPKKDRRCWSPELHRRFVHALEKLGGYQVATPKQIRELMQVNDLTNDEVKSHLQKYRLRIRKLPSSTTSLSKDKLFASYAPQLEVCSGGGGGPATLKTETSQSDSPQGPLSIGMRSANCNSATSRFDGIEDVDEDKSDSHGWEDQ